MWSTTDRTEREKISNKKTSENTIKEEEEKKMKLWK
jgi:hypothetical protein